MKLIFAQGNPGAPYARTRHNVGFMALDVLAAQHNADWKQDTKAKAEIAQFTMADEKILLVKPLSFYNETGQVARAIVDYYKLTPSTDVLVLHDELALPFGTIRVREKGSDAGNNGIKSLNAHLGEAYWRIRIGVWNELRDRMNDADFVLSAFSADEKSALIAQFEGIVVPLVEQFIQGSLENSSHKG